eukprot:gnl/TRDRNA2_/TRDRNA2_131777_c0_seq1.p1 gnl/TRDRNA2_/TRDRNA2_131777_c0~~gnl/TRDRNA2_/TRDRNA2_131777_c0_seq1.p1  ORF type:complete len:352 (+),score=59.19 gnl/TRDRNA2_/TRDRNA2_131777_c0_seq1:41-1057(+)
MSSLLVASAALLVTVCFAASSSDKSFALVNGHFETTPNELKDEKTIPAEPDRASPVKVQEKERRDVPVREHPSSLMRREQKQSGAPTRILPAVTREFGEAVEHLKAEAASVQQSVSSSWVRTLAARGPWRYFHIASCIIWATLLILVAFFHRRMPSNKETIFREEQLQSRNTADWSLMVWRADLWRPWSDMEVCLWSFLCPGIRWADSLSAAQLLGFWPAFLTFTVLSILGWLLLLWAVQLVAAGPHAPQAVALLRLVVFGWCGVTGAMMLLCVYFRQRIRQKFDMERDGSFVFQLIRDCITCFCCMPCMISQEAHQVRAAMAVGHKQAATVVVQRES